MNDHLVLLQSFYNHLSLSLFISLSPDLLTIKPPFFMIDHIQNQLKFVNQLEIEWNLDYKIPSS